MLECVICKSGTGVLMDDDLFKWYDYGGWRLRNLECSLGRKWSNSRGPSSDGSFLLILKYQYVKLICK